MKKPFRKLEPPKKPFSGEEDFEDWERSIDIWKRKYVNMDITKDLDNLLLGAELMEVVQEGAQEEYSGIAEVL